MSTLAANINPQSAAAALIVLVAVGYLARRVWLSVRRQRLGGCGSCASCPADENGNLESADGRPLVSLESLADSARREPFEHSQPH